MASWTAALNPGLGEVACTSHFISEINGEKQNDDVQKS
jgi:hypothetical protein